MALIHWQPWQEMEVLSRQLEQLFELTPSNSETANNGTKQRSWTPAVELTTNDTEVILRAEIPGVDAKDLDVQVMRDRVAIAGESRSTTKTEEAKFFRSEFRYGQFRRVVGLPVAVQNDEVKADFTNGVLTLILPRVQAERPKVVKLNLVGDAATTSDIAHDAEAATPELAATEPVQVAAETGDVWAEHN
jgi:HSP20 family protein